MWDHLDSNTIWWEYKWNDLYWAMDSNSRIRRIYRDLGEC